MLPQVQFSLLDRRPRLRMIDYCKSQGISLLPYGVVGGSFLTDRCGTAAGGGWLVWELCVRWGDSAHRRPVFTPSFTPHLQLCTPPPGQVPGG
jgi:hypothetical protein